MNENKKLVDDFYELEQHILEDLLSNEQKQITSKRAIEREKNFLQALKEMKENILFRAAHSKSPFKRLDKVSVNHRKEVFEVINVKPKLVSEALDGTGYEPEDCHKKVYFELELWRIQKNGKVATRGFASETKPYFVPHLHASLVKRHKDESL